jgi:hypothetical protein
MQSLGLDLYGFGAKYLTKVWMLQRTYNWQIMMPSDFGGMKGFLVSQYCQEVSFGDYSINELSVLKYGSEKRFYAGLQDIDSVTLTFLMPTDNSVLNYFNGWYNKMISPEGYYFPKSNYSRNIFVIMYNRAGVETTRFELKGAFVKKRPIFNLSYSEEDVLKIKIQLSIDSIAHKQGLLGQAVSAINELL